MFFTPNLSPQPNIKISVNVHHRLLVILFTAPHISDRMGSTVWNTPIQWSLNQPGGIGATMTETSHTPNTVVWPWTCAATCRGTDEILKPWVHSLQNCSTFTLQVKCSRPSLFVRRGITTNKCCWQKGQPWQKDSHSPGTQDILDNSFSLAMVGPSTICPLLTTFALLTTFCCSSGHVRWFKSVLKNIQLDSAVSSILLFMEKKKLHQWRCNKQCGDVGSPEIVLWQDMAFEV